MRVTNRTRHHLIVRSREYAQGIRPHETVDAPEDVVEAWAKRAHVAVLVDSGLVVLGDNPVKETETLETREAPEVPSVETPSPAPGVEAPEDADPTQLHWRRAIKLAEAEEDVDALMEWFAVEGRPKVLEAIEARMEALSGGE